MNVTLRIPDDIAARLTAEGADLEREALEGFALRAYQAGRLSGFELRQVLGIETRFELDAFLKERGVNDGTTLEEFQEQVDSMDRLGL